MQFCYFWCPIQFFVIQFISALSLDIAELLRLSYALAPTLQSGWIQDPKNGIRFESRFQIWNHSTEN